MCSAIAYQPLAELTSSNLPALVQGAAYGEVLGLAEIKAGGQVQQLGEVLHPSAPRWGLYWPSEAR